MVAHPHYCPVLPHRHSPDNRPKQFAFPVYLRIILEWQYFLIVHQIRKDVWKNV
jgi:hypothetical protein